MSKEKEINKIGESVEFIDELIDDEQIMMDGIKPKTDQDKGCIDYHQLRIIKLERVRRLLNEQKLLINLKPRIQIPFG